MPPRIFHSRITAVVLTGIVLWLAVLVVGATISQHTADLQVAQLKDEIADQQRDNDRIAQELDATKNPARLALLVRQRLNYRLPDELVAFVYKNEKVDIIPTPLQPTDTRSPWLKWWDWVRRK